MGRFNVEHEAMDLQGKIRALTDFEKLADSTATKVVEQKLYEVFKKGEAVGRQQASSGGEEPKPQVTQQPKHGSGSGSSSKKSR